MTILEIIREFCGRQGLPRPAAIAGNDDPMVVQLLGLANEIIEDLVSRGNWQVSTYKTTFLTVASNDQGALATLLPMGFRSLKQDSIYNRTTRLPVTGPISATEWEAYEALPTARIFPRYRFLGDHFLLQPPPPAGQTIGLEYQSEWLIAGVVGVVETPKAMFTADTDVFKLSSSILIAGLLWKWNEYKGLSYAEKFRTYEILVANAGGRDGTAPTLQLDGCSPKREPGIFVPSGNWLTP